MTMLNNTGASILSAFLIALVGTAVGRAEEAKIVMTAIGRVLSAETGVRIGTGFVAGETHNVFMPAHVAIKDTLLFQPHKSHYKFRIAIKYILDEFDLAIYQRTGGEQPVTFTLGNLNRMQPGDPVIYFGWENDSTLNWVTTTISAKGQTIHKDEIVDFIDLQGHGIPGYSGGPVFNQQGQVVAMVVQGWDIVPLNSKTQVRVMRAFSVDLLRVLERNLNISTRPDTSGQVGKLRLETLIKN
jgi:S1-C subfamily serine protease